MMLIHVLILGIPSKQSKSIYLNVSIDYTLTVYEDQGSRLCRPSILNTWYFRFGREYRLSVRLQERDFYEENISALEANFGWQEA